MSTTPVPVTGGDFIRNAETEAPKTVPAPEAAKVEVPAVQYATQADFAALVARVTSLVDTTEKNSVSIATLITKSETPTVAPVAKFSPETIAVFAKHGIHGVS